MPSNSDETRVAAQLAGLLGGEAVAGVSNGGSFARQMIDVSTTQWRQAMVHARDDYGFDFFDWLTAVDEEEAGYRVVGHLWNLSTKEGVLLRTIVPLNEPSIPSVTDLFPGAAWHERETHEMFGIHFEGHDNLRGLLLPDEFVGHPLRKEFVLASRAVKEWPGLIEPGRPEAATRRRGLPPGVPDQPWPLEVLDDTRGVSSPTDAKNTPGIAENVEESHEEDSPGV